MIPKSTAIDFPDPSYPLKSIRTGDPGSGRFQALLESQMASPSAPEGLVLSLLIEIINKIMVKGETESPGLSSLPPLFGRPEPVPIPIAPTPVPPEGGLPDRPAPVLDRQDIDTRIQEAAVRHGVDADLIRAVIEVESGFDPRAVSPAGARGLMQLMPTTAADLGVQNPFDPGQNIDGGTRYLKQLLGRYGGNRRLALAAYNWGMGNLEKRPEALPRETQRYLVKVEQSYRRYAGTALARADGRV